MGALVGGAARRSGTQARMSGPVTGTAASMAAAITILRAARTASGAVHRGTSRTVAAVLMREKCLGPGVLEPAVAVAVGVAAAAGGGELVTGFAPGRD